MAVGAHPQGLGHHVLAPVHIPFGRIIRGRQAAYQLSVRLQDVEGDIERPAAPPMETDVVENAPAALDRPRVWPAKRCSWPSKPSIMSPSRDRGRYGPARPPRARRRPH
jgi:hypothetical protein